MLPHFPRISGSITTSPHPARTVVATAAAATATVVATATVAAPAATVFRRRPPPPRCRRLIYHYLSPLQLKGGSDGGATLQVRDREARSEKDEDDISTLAEMRPYVVDAHVRDSWVPSRQLGEGGWLRVGVAMHSTRANAWSVTQLKLGRFCVGGNLSVLGPILNRLVNLEVLHLQKNPRLQGDLKYLKGEEMPQLKQVVLYGTDIETFEGLKMFSECKRLRFLDVSG